MRKVLMIAYAYPPSCRAGTYRSLRFSRYLPDEGWEPNILTLKENKCDNVDYGLIEKIPASVKIYRTPAFLFYKRVQTVRAKLTKSLKPNKDENTTGNNLRDKETKNHGNTDRIVWRRLLGDILRTPDEAVGWIPFAFIAGLFLIYKNKIDVIYATGGPFTSLVTGVLLKKITHKPLIVDFRDPWVAADFIKKRSHPFFSKISWNLEKRVLINADKIIANTSTLKEQFISNHRIDGGKIVVINNGFDEKDFQGLAKYNYDKFTISHIGSITSYRDKPINFFLALKEIINENKNLENKINAVFIGSGIERFNATINSLGLQKVVKLKDQLPHKEALISMCSSHILLLLGTAPNIIPSKVFEYFATKKPILALNSKGDLNNLFLVENVSGEVVEPDAVIKIKEALKRFYNKYQTGKLEEQPPKLLEKYNSKQLTKLLSKTLNTVCDQVG